MLDTGRSWKKGLWNQNWVPLTSSLWKNNSKKKIHLCERLDALYSTHAHKNDPDFFSWIQVRVHRQTVLIFLKLKWTYNANKWHTSMGCSPGSTPVSTSTSATSTTSMTASRILSFWTPEVVEIKNSLNIESTQHWLRFKSWQFFFQYEIIFYRPGKYMYLVYICLIMIHTATEALGAHIFRLNMGHLSNND